MTLRGWKCPNTHPQGWKSRLRLSTSVGADMHCFGFFFYKKNSLFAQQQKINFLFFFLFVCFFLFQDVKGDNCWPVRWRPNSFPAPAMTGHCVGSELLTRSAVALCILPASITVTHWCRACPSPRGALPSPFPENRQNCYSFVFVSFFLPGRAHASWDPALIISLLQLGTAHLSGTYLRGRRRSRLRVGAPRT